MMASAGHSFLGALFPNVSAYQIATQISRSEGISWESSQEGKKPQSSGVFLHSKVFNIIILSTSSNVT